jgi:23S rRNA pseudouridine1911/1915/1917 synthase
LDKDTSGLIVIAKENDAHFALAKQFAQRTTEKKYQALVWGVPKQPSGRIETNIGRSKKDRKVMTTYPLESGEGKLAVTDFLVKENYRYFSFLELTLHTGRTHQIRAHLQHIGNPILGDEPYGGRTIRQLGFSRSEKFVENLLDIMPRQALHAAFLAFLHPKTKQRVSFNAPLPNDMKQAIDKIQRLANGGE